MKQPVLKKKSRRHPTTKNLIINYRQRMIDILKDGISQGVLTEDHAIQTIIQLKKATGIDSFQEAYIHDIKIKALFQRSVTDGRFIILILRSDMEDEARYAALYYLNRLFLTFWGQMIDRWVVEKKVKKIKRDTRVRSPISSDSEDKKEESLKVRDQVKQQEQHHTIRHPRLIIPRVIRPQPPKIPFPQLPSAFRKFIPREQLSPPSPNLQLTLSTMSVQQQQN